MIGFITVLTASCAEDPAGPASSTRGEPTGLTPAATCSSLTVICPGESIQAAVDKSPNGTVFTIATGTHRRQRVVPKNGMKFIGEPSAIMDGEGVTPYAFDGSSQASNVTIKNLLIMRYAAPKALGAILGSKNKWTTKNWLVEGCEIRNTQTADGGGAGIKIGDGMIVRDNFLHHNDQYGVGGDATNAVIEDNEIAYNNWRQKHVRFVAGGTKFVRTRGLVVRGNYVHHNQGNGIWTDLGNYDVLIENNRVEYNLRQGIMHEVSHRAVIRNNLVRNNGTDADLGKWLYGAGILIAHSDSVEVYGNTVAYNHNGIAGIQQDRGDHQLRDLWVHDNTVRMQQGFTGVAGGTTRFNPYRANNRFNRNTYYLGINAKYFKWKNSLTEREWRAAGHDLNGTFHR